MALLVHVLLISHLFFYLIPRQRGEFQRVARACRTGWWSAASTCCCRWAGGSIPYDKHPYILFVDPFFSILFNLLEGDNEYLKRYTILKEAILSEVGAVDPFIWPRYF